MLIVSIYESLSVDNTFFSFIIKNLNLCVCDDNWNLWTQKISWLDL